MSSLFVRQILPDRFLLDDSHIRYVMTSPMGDWEQAQSFRNIAALYEALGLESAPTVAAVLTVLIFTVAVFTSARWSEIARFGMVASVVLAICFLCGVVYLGQYSKELIPILFVPLLMLLPRYWIAEVLFVAAAVSYAVLFRDYWIVVAALYIVWRVLLPRTRRPILIVPMVALLYYLLQVIFQSFLGVGLFDYRDLVNDSRYTDAVGSLITNPMPGTSGLASVAGALLLLAGLLFPVPLLLSGSPFLTLSGLMIALLWTTALIYVFSAKRIRSSTSSGGTHKSLTECGSTRALRGSRAAALLLAVVSVQTLFEPDFGSYLKHLTPLLPLFLALVPLRAKEALA